jgi:hypothetical protein
MDVMNKIRCLFEAGYKIHLHAFVYNRLPAKELEVYCAEVNYYVRSTRWYMHFSLLPFIVYTRNNKLLLKNLLSNNYPILFEGHHTCYYLNHLGFRDRKRLVRAHNIEQRYYFNLAKAENNIFKKIYFYLESLKLHCFENTLKKADNLLTINPNEHEYFSDKGFQCTLIPPFHSHNSMQTLVGKGDYILLHGNLSVPENINAVKYLVPLIRKASKYPIVIAGKEPDPSIFNLKEKFENMRIISSPKQEEMHELIQNAHMVILHTAQATGAKLKLLDSLYLGRFVIANDLMVSGTGLHELCRVYDDKDQLVDSILELINLPFDENMIKTRKEFLSAYSNQANCKKITDLLE